MIRYSKEEKIFRSNHKFGLCLSGGGTRGLAFLGALKAFEENGIKFDMVVGTSVGALVGAMYCAGLSYEEMHKCATELKNTDIKPIHFFPTRLSGLQKVIEKTIPQKRIEELKIPLYVVAVDLNKGEEVVYSSGQLSPILAGSCAVPWVFYPVPYKDKTLVDGMVMNNVPVDVLRNNGCDYMVTIDCNTGKTYGTKSKNAISQLIACLNLMLSTTSEKTKRLSDIIINIDLHRYSPLNLTKREEMIEMGYTATIKNMKQIKALFKGKFNSIN